VRNDDGVFMELTVGQLSTVMVPLERLGAADQGIYVAPTTVMPMEVPGNPTVVPPARNEWVDQLAVARASKRRRSR
jgi:hypothetical protein